MKKKVIFLLSVDTEEEFDWNGDFPQTDCDVENVQFLPEFQQFCELLGIRPTYLVDYPVATTPSSYSVLNDIATSSKAEIGAHLHPWCNPPFEGGNGESESHVVNLPTELVEKKLGCLVEAIKENIGVSPRVFRTGRWGINSDVINVIQKAGFTVDSSIYPFYENAYFSCSQAPHTPYWPSLDNPDEIGEQRQIFEIPITAGFNRPDFRFWSKVHKRFENNALKFLRPIGIAWHLNALRKLYLSPELCSASNLKGLINAALKEDQSVIHMYLHSSSLLPSKNGLIDANKNLIYDRISTAVKHLMKNTDIDFMTLSEAKLSLTGKSSTL